MGYELRLARSQSTVKGVKACEDLGWSSAKLSKLESGARGAIEWDVATLLGRYVSDRSTRDRLRLLTSEPDIGYFLRCHGLDLPESLTAVSMHERLAATIVSFDPVVIPSLVQSADYARELLRASAADAEQLEAMVENRMRRRDEIVYGADGPEILIYLSETALSKSLGSDVVMQDQLYGLVMMVRSGAATIRVIPSGVSHASLRHGGTRLDLPNVPQLVYAETDLMTVVYDDASLVERWNRKLRQVDELALSPEASIGVLVDYTDAYDRRAPSRSAGPRRHVDAP
ncbi:DUF5753 domain-containing protein [Umezawaea tangerina]|uniref:DUF5753 domain-containing protein n=1 Tax=Umezawaea tangerina TaxID=84725 RepID=A0A2T0S723_9PSEU|nr:DUF5753 domain-containing protein [Umezawaea tangerina]PRY29195.1 hypothetical protein CLV43_12672 [Umezawaea tangerina]